MVPNLCQRMGIPMPKLWVIPEESPNAFATGRNPVAFVGRVHRWHPAADGRYRELEGVIAHELGHVLHRDILISSIAATHRRRDHACWPAWRCSSAAAGTTTITAAARGRPLLMMILAPIAAMLIQMAISRTRDIRRRRRQPRSTPARPYGLITGLRRSSNMVEAHPDGCVAGHRAHVHHEAVHRRERHAQLFSTHPSTEDRIARLQAIR